MSYDDPIQKAIDDYITMEQKAWAWDELRRLLEELPEDRAPIASKLLDKMKRLLQTAKVTADNGVVTEGSLPLPFP